MSTLKTEVTRIYVTSRVGHGYYVLQYIYYYYMYNLFTIILGLLSPPGELYIVHSSSQSHTTCYRANKSICGSLCYGEEIIDDKNHQVNSR